MCTTVYGFNFYGVIIIEIITYIIDDDDDDDDDGDETLKGNILTTSKSESNNI